MMSWKVRIKSTWKLIVLLCLILITFSYAMFQGGFVSWFLFYSFVPFGLYSFSVALYSLKDIQVKRIIPEKELSAGEKIKVELVFNRRSFFPIFYLLIEDQLPKTMAYKSSSKGFLFPSFRRNWTYQYDINEIPRGEHEFQYVRVKTGDPIGLFEKEILLKCESNVLVYPAYVNILYRPIENHFEQGMTSSRERIQRDTSMAIGIREYQPGDRFSWINWKATARRNEVMTKQFEQRQSHDVLLIVDRSKSIQFEAVVSFTASLARGILRKGAQIGILSIGEERTFIPIRGGDMQQQTIFYHLASVSDNAKVSLDRVIQTESFKTMQHVTLSFITGNLTKTLVENASNARSGKESVVIYLLKNKNEAATANEISLRSSAAARGVYVKIVHEGHFEDAFVEVNR